MDSIASLEEAFPNASKHNRDPEIARIVDLWGKGRYGWARYWVDVYERAHLFCSSIPDRTQVIRYEDLVMNPESVMSSAVSFLGEDPGRLHCRRLSAKKRAEEDFRTQSSGAPPESIAIVSVAGKPGLQTKLMTFGTLLNKSPKSMDILFHNF